VTVLTTIVSPAASLHKVETERTRCQSYARLHPEGELLVGAQVESTGGKVATFAGGEASGADELGAVATLLGSRGRGVGGSGDVGSCCPGAVAIDELVHCGGERDQRRAFGPRCGTTAGAGLAHDANDVPSYCNCSSR
jgi:hypothetical protein